MSIKIVGELEVDIERGVLYFHNYTNGLSTLRICGLRDKLDGFSVKSQIDVTIPIVMRSEMEGMAHRPVPQKVTDPRTFFLGDAQTTHTTKAQARKERAQARSQRAAIKKLDQAILGRADHLLKPGKNRKTK